MITPPKDSSHSGNKITLFFEEVWRACLRLPKHLAHLAEKIKTSVSELWIEWDKFWQDTGTPDLSALDVRTLQPQDQADTASASHSPIPTTPSKPSQLRLISFVSNAIFGTNHAVAPPPVTAQPPSVTAQPPSVTAQPPSVTAQPPSVTVKPTGKNLATTRLSTYDVPRDGSCYYYAFVVQLVLSGNTKLWEQMTKILQDTQKKNPQWNGIWNFSNEGHTFEDWIKQQGGVAAFRTNHSSPAKFFVIERLLRIAIADKLEEVLNRDDEDATKIELASQIDPCALEAKLSTKIPNTMQFLQTDLRKAIDAHKEMSALSSEFSKLSKEVESEPTRRYYAEIQKFLKSQESEENRKKLALIIETLSETNAITDLGDLVRVEEEVGKNILKKGREAFIAGIRDVEGQNSYAAGPQTRILEELFQGSLRPRVWRGRYSDNTISPHCSEEAPTGTCILELYLIGEHYQAINTEDPSTREKLQQTLSTIGQSPPAIGLKSHQTETLYNRSFKYLINLEKNYKNFLKIKMNLPQRLLKKIINIQNLAKTQQSFLEKSQLQDPSSKELQDKLRLVSQSTEQLNQLLREIHIKQPFNQSFEIYKKLYKLETQLQSLNFTTASERSKNPDVYKTYLEWTKEPPEESPPSYSRSQNISLPRFRSAQLPPILPTQKEKTLPQGAIPTIKDGTCLIYGVLMSSILDDQAYKALEKHPLFGKGLQTLITQGGGLDQVRTYIRTGQLVAQFDAPFTKAFKKYAQTFRESVSHAYLTQIQSSEPDSMLRVDAREALQDSYKKHSDEIDSLNQQLKKTTSVVSKCNGYIQKTNLLTSVSAKQADTEAKARLVNLFKETCKERRHLLNELKGDKSKKHQPIKDACDKLKIDLFDPILENIKQNEDGDHTVTILAQIETMKQETASLTPLLPSIVLLEKNVKERLDKEYVSAAKDWCVKKSVGFSSLEETYAHLLASPSFYFDHKAIDVLAQCIGIKIAVWQYRQKPSGVITLDHTASYNPNPDSEKSPAGPVSVFEANQHYSAYQPMPTSSTDVTTSEKPSPSTAVSPSSSFTLYPLSASFPPPQTKETT